MFYLNILFETKNARFIKEVKFEKEENIKNIVFKEEYVNNIGQILVSITVQETTPILEDNVQTIVLNIVSEQDCDGFLPQTPTEQPQEVSYCIKEKSKDK
ncbi:hypothetical protein CR513_02720, partial [Mucuna pruriens]